jgi:[histone H3]-trimethyl-L-lysine4 demethylase
MNLNRFPSVDKRPLDLYKLKKAVETRGGFDRVCKLKKWAEIGRDLGYSGKIMSSLSTSLKNSYQKWLSPYEEYLRVAKPGVQQQREFEYGGPLTPSPANSPMNRSHSQKGTPASSHADSPAMRASTALNTTVRASDEADKPTTSGFTAVNSGGFTPVNAPGPQTNGVLKRENDGSTTNPQHVASNSNTPDHQDSPMLGVSPIPNGMDGIKRTVSHESANGGSSADSGTNADSETPSGRRSSKRQKKDAIPTVAGSHMSLFRPLVPRALGPKPGMSRAKDTKPGERCEGCGQPETPSELVICDSCDNGYHRNCMDPPIKATGDWNCPKCLVGTGEFGFEEGGTYSLKQFQEKATNFKESYFAPKMPFDPILNRKRPATEDDVEREFWRLVESITETVEVEYGADIHSTTHGSGFPDSESAPTDPYSANPWNLNVLPLHAESLFRHIKSDISGMTVPWLYVGMCFSTFCWHNEDHYTYSANYQHFGATKTWYGIPGADAEKFEQAMREAVPELFEQQPDLLFQLVTLLPPDQLRRAGVNVYALDQRAGQFVITFPQAYHAGFNHGFNFNEAVNFAPADWEPFGQAGVERLQEFRRQPCFSHDELLITAAARDPPIKTAKWLAPALGRLQENELKQRQEFLTRHLGYKDHHCKIVGGSIENCDIGFEKDETDLPEEEYQCAFCKSFTYLSRYQCLTSGRVMCLLHAGVFDCCGATMEQRHMTAEHTVRYRLSDDDLKSLVAKIVDRSRAPELWQEKLDKVLENDPKPPLKTLRSLVSEGERIPYDVPGLADLKAFVERCSEWLEEATNYIVRKQQNRRKNERAWRKASKGNADDERESNARRLEHMYNLVNEADQLAFDDPVIATLRERAEEVTKFRYEADVVLRNPGVSSRQDIEELIEMGKGFNVDVPEVEQLEAILKQLKWTDRATEMRQSPHTLADVEDLLKEGTALGLHEPHPEMAFWADMRNRGNLWEAKATELISAETIHYHQLEALANQASTVPVSAETRAKIDHILSKQREAHRRIISLCEMSKDPDLEKRPKYRDVRELLDSLQDLNSKPAGTMDLEKEAKRHEDWMRRGKKLFGKANAPLHILLQHMSLVRDRNDHCLNLEDKPRMPVEPASRDQTPVEDQKFDPRDVFCICRQPEGGMMIECELCHEW